MHDRVIPQEEIWVKIGGDKGETTLKNVLSAVYRGKAKFHPKHSLSPFLRLEILQLIYILP